MTIKVKLSQVWRFLTFLIPNDIDTFEEYKSGIL